MQTQPLTTLDELDIEWTTTIADSLVPDTGMTAQQLLDHLSGLEPQTRDQSLLPLLRSAQAGDRTTQHLILRMMRSSILSIATKRMPLRARPHHEAINTAVGAMLETVALYPTDRWLSHVTTNLVRKTAARLVAEDLGATSVDTINVDDDMLEELATLNTPTHENPEESITKVLTWALDTGTLSRDQIRIMATWELGDDEARTRLSYETGTSLQSLRIRSYRYRRIIHEAVLAHINNFGSW